MALDESNKLFADTLDSPTEPTVSGNVTRLFHQSPKFSAGEIAIKGRVNRFAVSGYVSAVGDFVTLHGDWVHDPKFGRQYKATAVEQSVPTDLDGISRWIAGNVMSIGTVKAQRMIDEFGTDLMKLCCEDAGQVAAACQLKIEVVQGIAEQWSKYANKIATQSQLLAWGLTQHQADLIVEKYGTAAAAIVRDNPYRLLGDVHGFGWKTTDELAEKIGITGSDGRRLRGALAAVVRESRDEGSTCIIESVALETAASKLGGRVPVPTAAISAEIDQAIADRGIVRIETEKKSFLATPFGFHEERDLWRFLKTGQEPNPTFGLLAEDRAKTIAAGYANVHGATLDAGQLRAVELAASHRILTVTGGAGAGKTLVARAIYKLFRDGDARVALCAPTGKAARRLTEVIGREASTIHRLLEFTEGTFQRWRGNLLDYDVVIVDEVSMCDVAILHRLFDAIGPKTSLVLIGDVNQLPPVGTGAVLRDVLANDLTPIVRLEGCHRQAGTLKQNCSTLLAGRVEPCSTTDPEPWPWVVNTTSDNPEKVTAVVKLLYSKFLPKWGYDAIKDAQFMTAKHDGPLGTRRLNLILQKMHQETLGVALPEPAENEHHFRPTLHAGDKVIQTRNNYTLDVMNGTVGVVLAAKPSLVVSYPDRNVLYEGSDKSDLELAYCLTPHRMQGSEIPCAIVLVPKAHAFMQNRSWLYTAATRARKTCVLIGDGDALRKAAERVDTSKRLTLLDVFANYPESQPK